jgi:ribosome-binding ATPase YchF (GTP1/OBG family)
MKADLVIALAGNANVGKSSIFNQLTGLGQIIGNWPGKTVEKAEGMLLHHGKHTPKKRLSPGNILHEETPMLLSTSSMRPH